MLAGHGYRQSPEVDSYSKHAVYIRQPLLDQDLYLQKHVVKPRPQATQTFEFSIICYWLSNDSDCPK